MLDQHIRYMKKILNRKTIFIILLLSMVFGFWVGYRTHYYLSRKGCYALSSEPQEINISPEFNSRLRIAALGDMGTADENQKQVAEGLKRVCNEKGCDLILFLGDNFMKKGVTSLKDPLLKTAFENNYTVLDKPVIAVLGNHDVKGNALVQVIYGLKNPQWNMPNYSYSFKVGPARFFAINTNCNIFGWIPLRDKLSQSSSHWTFVYGHHPVYSSGTHGDNELQIRWFWEMLVQKNVDFYLSGHNHLLEHLRYNGDKTDYIVNGAGGSHYRSTDKSKIRSSEADSRFRYLDTGFVWFEVTESIVVVEFFNAQGISIYKYSKRK